MMDVEKVFKEALKECGITSPEAFTERYGVALDTVPLAVSLSLLLAPEHPRSRDRATWTPIQREHRIAGCLLALTAMRERLVRGLVILAERPTVANEECWFVLATRAVRIIGKLSYASTDAGVAFCESLLGRWYFDLEWPEPSDGVLQKEW
jgi:hypothetical protein